MTKPIAKQWQRYRSHVLPGNAPAIQIDECEGAFYAGAKALFELMMTLGEAEVSETQGIGTIETVGAELDEYIAAYVRRHRLSGGDA